MNSESRRDLQLLEALEQDASITQRTLATRLGIALGLTNLYLRRLVRKGYVKCVTVSPNRIMYLVTPRGVARRARLAYEFMKYSLDFYRDVRRHLRSSLSDVVAAQKRIALYGTGDAAELVFLLLSDMGADLVAVFSEEERKLGFTVRELRDHQAVDYDVLIVAVLERPAAARKRVIASGVPAEKVLMLQPIVPKVAAATSIGGTTTEVGG
jgi:DNA-binding MarR family transcriptional regulator